MVIPTKRLNRMAPLLLLGLFLIFAYQSQRANAQEAPSRADGLPHPGTATTYEGYHEAAGCWPIYGWVWDNSRPDATVNVDIYDGESLLASIPANKYRGNLVEAGKGNGYHSFVYYPPDSLRDGRAHLIRVSVAGTRLDLTGTPREVMCEEADEATSKGNQHTPLLFTEPLFLFLFLPVVLVLYLIAPRRVRNGLLLGASLLFYAWGEGKYVLVLLLSILINYVGGLAIRNLEARRRRLILLAALAGNLALLVVFKYAGFLVANLNQLLGLFHLALLPVPGVRLPIGISFFTFMGMSYVIDVYRKQIRAEGSLKVFALYLTMFPHLIAGPIVRYGEIADELRERGLTRTGFAEGIQRFITGLGKKVIIANTLALTADKIFALGPAQLSTRVAWLGVVCYSLQIYFDFSGYTDMAIGLARMFGFHFPENFNYPYLADSITDFWRRWHTTLSRWFRDYLFFPLGVRRPRWRIYLNLLIVFFVCGLWHGARWTFIVWGLFHGAFLVFERMGLADWLAGRAKFLRRLYALLVIMTGWVFFRAETTAQALSFLGAMGGLAHGVGIESDPGFYLNAELLLALALGALGSVPVVPMLSRWQERLVESQKTGARAALAESCVRLLNLAASATVFLASAAISAAGTYNPFIYFRF